MRQEIEKNLASKHHLLDFMIDSSLTYRKDRDNRYLIAFRFTIGNATSASSDESMVKSIGVICVRSGSNYS